MFLHSPARWLLPSPTCSTPSHTPHRPPHPTPLYRPLATRCPFCPSCWRLPFPTYSPHPTPHLPQCEGLWRRAAPAARLPACPGGLTGPWSQAEEGPPAPGRRTRHARLLPAAAAAGAVRGQVRARYVAVCEGVCKGRGVVGVVRCGVGWWWWVQVHIWRYVRVGGGYLRGCGGHSRWGWQSGACAVAALV